MGIGKRAEIEGEGEGEGQRERERAHRRYEEVQLSNCLCVWLEVLRQAGRQAVERLRRGAGCTESSSPQTRAGSAAAV